MTVWQATQFDIERWLDEAGAECREADWQSPYKLGYMQALTAVMCKMDDSIRASRAVGETREREQEMTVTDRTPEHLDQLQLEVSDMAKEIGLSGFKDEEALLIAAGQNIRRAAMLLRRASENAATTD